MTDSQKLDLILEKVTTTDGSMKLLDKRISTLEKKVDSLNKEMKSLHEKVNVLEDEVRILKFDIKGMKTDIEGLKTDIEDVKTDIKDMKMEITGINLTLENEIRVNIIRTAEGHLDLSRKLDEYIKLSNEIKDKQEITDIYIKMHDNKLRALA